MIAAAPRTTVGGDRLAGTAERETRNEPMGGRELGGAEGSAGLA